MTIIKLCGLTQQSDVEYAAELGADICGFVFEPSSPRYVGESEWSPEWLNEIPVEKAAVFGAALHRVSTAFSYMQAFAWPASVEWHEPKIHVVRLGDPSSSQASAFTDESNSFVLLDAYHPVVHGGAGKTVDWNQAALLVAASRRPVILAGGLTPDNVAEAIAKVKPFGVDVSSGIESEPGKKDRGKMKAFVEAVRQS